MKKLFIFGLIIFLFGSFVIAQDMELPRVSQKATVSQRIGLTDVTITYSRPGVKGRPIWGGLVPYNEVWRTGANEATTISVSDDVKINGQPLPAGSYSLHTIPGKDSWTIIFNKVDKQWGSFKYDKSKDALRVDVKPQEGPNVEWMTFSFPDVSGNSGTVELAWEKVRVPFHIEANTVAKAMANIRKTLSGDVKDWSVPYDAADYAMNANLENKDEAMKWIDQSIALKETFWNLRLKADLLAAQGKTADAIATAEKAVKLADRDAKDEPGEVAKTQKQITEWKSGAKNH
jgi:Protein of unknown function (DUF2911)